MKKICKVSVSLLLVALMCFSTLSPFAIALSGNVDNIDTTVNAPEHDISVMSFNILEYDTSNVGYAPPRTRAPYVIATIKKYMPDIVGIQEAADARALNDNLDWNNYIATELGKLGYGFRQLSQEPAHPSSQGGMTIGAGLMILYKTDRFELKDHGSDQYGEGANGVTGSYQGYSSNDKSRFFHWVKLWDKEKSTFVYTFNTHLSINPTSSNTTPSTSDSNILKQIGHHRRSQEIKEMIAYMEKVSTKYPCFATGDYNTHWNDSVKDSTTQNLLYGMTANNIIADSGLDAPIQITHSGRMSNIDHVFYNKTVSTALQVHHVFEDFGGNQPSDHKAVMSYFNYGTTQTFTAGNYDPITRTFTDNTEESTYSLPLEELPEYISYRIFDINGNEVAEPLNLTANVNRYSLRFYNESTTGSADKVFGETSLVIRTTAALPPSVTATNTENVYFANDAFHVLVKTGQTGTTLTVTGGRLQNMNGQNIVTNITSLPAAINNYRIKGNDGTVYPLYVYKPTLSAESGKHLYIDDDIGEATGTVAYSNEDGVLYLTAGTNGFGSLTAAAAVANTADGYTLHIAPGLYKENSVTFTKDVTLLGNNENVSPLSITDAVWSKAERREESEIRACLYFNRAGNISTVVKGLKFSGLLKQGPLNWPASNTAYTISFEIANNIFESSTTDMASHACIYLNTPSRKKGHIYDNYFFSPHESTTSIIRALHLRNSEDVVFEQNWCIGFTTTCLYVSSEVSNGSKEAGYGNFTAQYNRFENSVQIAYYVKNVTADTSAHAKFLYNDFIRCGYPNTHTMYVNLDEADKSPTTFKNVSLNVFGNRFIDCSRGLTITRTAHLQGDMRDMKMNIQQNRFVDCNEFRYINSLYFYCYGGKDKTQNVYSENWDCSHNYFSCDDVSGHDPKYFVNNKISSSVTSLNISKLCYPYYTNLDLSWLSDSSTAPKQSAPTLSNNRHEYDGHPHSLDINAGEDAVVSYSLDSATNRVYSLVRPTLTEPGTLTVFYQVERPGYQNYYGRGLITVTVPKRELVMENVTVPYDGKAHSLNPAYNALPGDKISYSYNGIPFDSMPTFMNAGSYAVTITVENEYADPKVATATATLTITAGEFTDVALEITDEINLIGNVEGATILYSVDGGASTAQKPTLTGNEQSISVTLSRPGYNDLTLIAFTDKENHPFTLSLVKTSENNQMVWSMALTADRQALLQNNITLLSYGFVTAETTDKLTDATPTAVRENETGILSFEERISFSAPADAPTMAYATYIKDGALFSVFSTIGAK